MEINLYTKNLIILKYPSNAGGKFIRLCLAINEKILHQDKYLAKKKITKKLTQLNSFKISKSILEKKISIQQHFELGCDQLAGFKAKHSVIEQEKLANEFWKELTNQNEYKFFMVDHHGKNWSHYPNSKHIFFENYDRILELRNLNNKNIQRLKPYNDNHIKFDMESVFDKTSFYKEISKISNFLNINQINIVFIEEMRKLFLKTVSIGF